MTTPAKPMIHRLLLTKARINLGAVVRDIHLNKDYVILEKDGIPIVGMMDSDEFEDYLELRDRELKNHISEGYVAYRKGDVRDAREFMNELKAGISKKREHKAKRP